MTTAVVVGSHGYNRFVRTLLGSVSQDPWQLTARSSWSADGFKPRLSISSNVASWIFVPM
jgi:hypothetical protein